MSSRLWKVLGQFSGIFLDELSRTDSPNEAAVSRTLTGRMRLMEERMGIFMDVLETQNDSLEERISRLEQRESPAA